MHVAVVAVPTVSLERLGKRPSILIKGRKFYYFYKVHRSFENRLVYYLIQTEFSSSGVKRLERDAEIQLYDSQFRKT
jgi:hypothetical protein